MPLKRIPCAVLVALLLPGLAVAQETRGFERDGVPELTLELTFLRVIDGATSTVPPDHVYRPGEGLAFELEANRGGYVRLEVPDETPGDGGKLLWPSTEAGHPVEARKTLRLPGKDESPITFSGQGPSTIDVVFALRPLEGSKRTGWLKQIRFRDPELADRPADRPPSLRFTGQAAELESVRMEIVVQHGVGDE